MKFSQETEKKKYEPLPAAVYTGTIVEATESGDGTYIQMRIDCGQGSVFDRLYSDNATKAKFVSTAIGKKWDGSLSAADLEGKQVSIDVSIQEKGDKTFNRVVSYQPAAEPTPSHPQPTTIKDEDIPF